MAPLVFNLLKNYFKGLKNVLILIDFIVNQSAIGYIVQVTKNKTCSDTLNSPGHQVFLFPTTNDKINADVFLCRSSKVVALKALHTLNKKKMIN